jgi:exo-beta-1,3-glucanase (GH17 family)
MKRLLLVLTMVFATTACSPGPDTRSGPVKVEIVETETGYQLLRGGEPYVVRGAGMEVDDLERFAARGGNAIRTWSTLGNEQDTLALLDAAQANGVTVALGLPMQAERHGFDYDDPEAVAEQLAIMREEVLRYRDHPAVLVWLIGNELNHSYGNPRVYDAVNDVAAMIRELDPNHLTSTTITGFEEDVVAEILERAPELDFISFQLYGALFGLPDKVQQAGFDRPFMVTEWGTIGYWGMETTDWGIPAELTSSEKADIILRGHNEVLATLGDQLIGNYVFFWGQKQERTHTWFGLLMDTGEETEAVDVMQYLWTGNWSANRAPRVNSISLNGNDNRAGAVLRPGQVAVATLEVVDDAPLTFHWEIKPESTSISEGGDYEAPIPNIDGALSATDGSSVSLTAPEPGAYRLYAYAYDGQGYAAHANVPFLVTDDTMEGEAVQTYRQTEEDLLMGEVMALSYSGFREGQHPDRGEGAVNPSNEEILEDLRIMADHDFRLIRMYDSAENTRTTIELIRDNDLPIKVLLGAWLKAEVSNHEGAPWLEEPIPDEELIANKLDNEAELRRTIALANEYDDIVVAVNVGNEALVEWNDHMVPLETVIRYVRQMKAAIEQPVTVADNYLWWIRDGAPLAAEVDFLGVHTYAQWEEKTIDESMAFTIENIQGVHHALPDKPIVILEAGWATVASEFGERASEAYQDRYYRELKAWAEATNTTVFFFEAFDEPWKGDPDDPLGAEKHWGLFNVDRTPKSVMQ